MNNVIIKNRDRLLENLDSISEHFNKQFEFLRNNSFLNNLIIKEKNILPFSFISSTGNVIDLHLSTLFNIDEKEPIFARGDTVSLIKNIKSRCFSSIKNIYCKSINDEYILELEFY